jgi:PAS domain S-box-containing protein
MPERKLKQRIFIPLIISLLVVAAGTLSYLIIHSSRKQTEIAVGRELRAIAIGVRDRLPTEKYAQLFYRGDVMRSDWPQIVRDPIFAELRALLNSALVSNEHLNLSQDNLYTFVVPPAYGKTADKLFWGIMTHPEPFTGEVYTPPVSLLKIIEARKPGYSHVYTSTASKREWISAYAPIVYQDKTIGIVEVAREITEVLSSARAATWPSIIIGIGVIVLFAVAAIVILRIAKGIERANVNLGNTLDALKQSTAMYRHLTESTSEIIFALDRDFKITALNSAMRRQLGVDAAAAIGTDFTDTLFGEQTGNDMNDRDFFIQNMQQLSNSGQRFNMVVALRSALTGESRDFKIRVEKIPENSEMPYMGRISSVGETAVTNILDKARLSFTLANSIALTEEMATYLAGLCRRYVGENALITYRVMLREMLLNAIEHGNLAIDFEQKSQAMLEDRYFALIEERRSQKPYCDRVVTVDCQIDPDKLAFRITDEGDGFDHRSMISRLTDQENETQHGRGIVMTMAEFDTVRYNEKGNQVLLVKNLRTS